MHYILQVSNTEQLGSARMPCTQDLTAQLAGWLDVLCCGYGGRATDSLEQAYSGGEKPDRDLVMHVHAVCFLLGLHASHQ